MHSECCAYQLLCETLKFIASYERKDHSSLYNFTRVAKKTWADFFYDESIQFG